MNVEKRLDLFADVIGSSVLRKYDDFPAERVRQVVGQTVARTNEIVGEEALTACLREISSPEDDISNQAIVLELIRRFWGAATPERPVERIHQAISGNSSTMHAIRSKEFVEDFGGIPPTALDQIVPALNELNLLIERLVRPLRAAPLSAQAAFAAHVFSSIIRVHPFEDANGRAARYVVQLCVMTWKDAFLPLPKVRNDQAWGDALNRAVNGHVDALRTQFEGRLRKAGKV